MPASSSAWPAPRVVASGGLHLVGCIRSEGPARAGRRSVIHAAVGRERELTSTAPRRGGRPADRGELRRRGTIPTRRHREWPVG